MKNFTKKFKIIIITAIITIFSLLIGGVIWWGKQKNLPSTPAEKPDKLKPDQPLPLPNNENKEFADKIKTDLQVRLERVKNGSRTLEDLLPYIIGNKKTALCNVNDLNFIKVKDGEEISADDIGEKNFQSIANLFKQIRSAKEEWEEKMKQKAQAKADTNPNLFYFPAAGSFIGGILTDEITHCQFTSRQEGKEYRLTIPKLHPNLAGISIKSDDWNIYRITGVENIPLVPCPIESVKVPYKIVKLSDRFTIEKIDF